MNDEKWKYYFVFQLPFFTIRRLQWRFLIYTEYVGKYFGTLRAFVACSNA